MPAVCVLAETAFWSCAIIVLYVYFGYPLSLLSFCMHRRGPTDVRVSPPLPKISILIAAYNEEQSIVATIENKLGLDYPENLLEIIVVSDGSTDATDEMVRRIDSKRVRLVRQERRQGKTSALNRAVAVASGDFLVFSDANSLYDRSAVRELVAAMADPKVGYATGLLVHPSPGVPSVGRATSIYLRYENWVRTLETRASSVVGVNGGIDIVRRSLYSSMRPDHLPDFVLPLRVIEQGYRVVFSPLAIAREEALVAAKDEYRMRVRVSLRSLHTLWEFRQLLSPRYGLYAFQLFVHKWLRYLSFVPLTVLVVSSVFLLGRPFYFAALCAQLLFYGAAGFGFAYRGRINSRWMLVPLYFSLINAAAAVALFKFLRGERQVTWTPRKGA